jgi:hypothetical protein
MAENERLTHNPRRGSLREVRSRFSPKQINLCLQQHSSYLDEPCHSFHTGLSYTLSVNRGNVYNFFIMIGRGHLLPALSGDVSRDPPFLLFQLSVKVRSLDDSLSSEQNRQGREQDQDCRKDKSRRELGNDHFNRHRGAACRAVASRVLDV